MSDQVIQTSKY